MQLFQMTKVQALADDFRFWDARDAVNERFLRSERTLHYAICSRRASVSCGATGQSTLFRSNDFD